MPIVTFLPKEAATKITVPGNVIGIWGPYDYKPEYKCTHTRYLGMQFANFYEDMPETAKRHLITDEMIQELLDFVASVPDSEDIIVHCGEGMIRSPAVAQFIEMLSDFRRDEEGFEPRYMSTKYEGCKGSTHHLDRNLFWRLREYFDKKQDEANGTVWIDRDAVMVKLTAAGLTYEEFRPSCRATKRATGFAWTESEVDETIRLLLDKTPTELK